MIGTNVKLKFLLVSSFDNLLCNIYATKAKCSWEISSKFLKFRAIIKYFQNTIKDDYRLRRIEKRRSEEAMNTNKSVFTKGKDRSDYRTNEWQFIDYKMDK